MAIHYHYVTMLTLGMVTNQHLGGLMRSILASPHATFRVAFEHTVC